MSELDTQETEVVEAEESIESTEQPDALEAEDTQDDGEEQPFDAARALAKIKKANSEARTQRERAKAAEDKAKGLEPVKREAAEQRVARRLGLPDTEEVDEFLSRLKGETVDELAEDAERLLSLLTPKGTKPAPTKPTERLRGGGKPDAEPEETDPAKLAAAVVKARGF